MDARKLRRYLIAMLAIVALGFTTINMWMVDQLSTTPAGETPQQSFAPAAIGGAFSLTDQNGNVVTDQAFRGKLMFVYFGFTSCPDVCPVSLLSMTNVLNKLGEDAAKIAPIFITLDPERDSPKKLKAFLANFHPSFIGLTGPYADIEKVKDAYKAYGAIQPADADGNYLVDHSGYVYVMGKNGEYLAHFSHDASEEEMVKALQGFLK